MTVRAEWEALRDALAYGLDTTDPNVLLTRLEGFSIDQTDDETVLREWHQFRGELHVLGGRNSFAEEAFRKARSYTLSVLYAKYVTELRLGDVSGCADWYRAALRTAIGHGRMPCGAALVSLIESGEMTDHDQDLVMLCLRMCWQSMNLPGEPSIDQIPSNARFVFDREGGSA